MGGRGGEGNEREEGGGLVCKEVKGRMQCGLKGGCCR